MAGAEPEFRDRNRALFARLRVELELAFLSTHLGATERGFRSLRTTAILLAVSGVASVLVLARLHASAASDVIALRLLAYASWIYGWFGLSVLLRKGPGEVPALARLRGFEAETGFTRGLGLFVRLARGMLFASLPTFFAAALVAPTPRLLSFRLLLVPLVVLYVSLLAGALALIASFAERFRPNSPRLTTAMIVLGPFAISLAGVGLPNLPGAFGWALAQMIRLGGYAT